MPETTLDPVTFEVLRHRIWAITEEGASALHSISGSPSVAQSNDCNVALLNLEGEGVMIGATLATHAASCIHTAKYVYREYGENPGIGVDDMFLSNHPYISTPHQTCAVVVAPIHWEEKLIGWSGAGIHLPDVGGPVPGQVAVGAQSIFEEPTPMPPVKLVEAGVIRKDIEEDWLIRSRTRAQNALDMRAKIAANNTIKRRVLEIVGRYGPGVMAAVMERIIEVAEAKLRSVLRELPDGTWRYTGYLDYNDRGQTTFYTCKLAMTKEDDSLTFDFSGSSEQAPAVINCTPVTLMSSMMIQMLNYFGFVIPLCPGAVTRVVKLVAEPGTFVNSSWPAGASKGTTAASYTVRHAVATCVSKMFAASPSHRRQLLTVAQGQMSLSELVGTDQRGEPFGGVFMDACLTGGFGARSFKDGVDSGGPLAGARISIPNVERNEFRYPILYLFRKHGVDTGGPGRFRGGASTGYAFTPHDVERIPNHTVHGLGYQVPTALGLNGGYPGNTNQFLAKRASNIWELFGAGIMPADIDGVSGETEVPPGISFSYLNRADVYWELGSGGGGYGDPIDRDPDLVATDVVNGLVSPEWAKRIYGVVIDPKTLAADAEATRGRREAIKGERRASATPPLGPGSPESPAEVVPVQDINEFLQIVERGGRRLVRCQCGEVLGPAAGNYKDHLAVYEGPCSGSGPHTLTLVAEPRFVYREFYCPSCFLLLDVEVVERGAAVEQDVEFRA